LDAFEKALEVLLPYPKSSSFPPKRFLDIRKSTEIVKRFDREGFILILLVHSL
jgi:hypothetical protein